MRPTLFLFALGSALTLSLTASGQRRAAKAPDPATLPPTPAVAPADTSRNQLATRPTIMVFPFFREGQNLRQVVEDDANNRVVMAKVKEAFDKRGYSTLDYLSKVRNLNVSDVLTGDTKSDLKSQLIQSSGADICVEVEYRYTESPTGNEVSVVLNAYESSTSSSLSNKVGSSGKFYSQDVAKLTSRAADPILDDFLNVMQQKFTDIVQNGRYLSLEVGLAEGSDLTMNTEVGADGLALSDALEVWIGEHTKSYHILGVSALKTTFDVLRVPRLDPQGRPLTTTRYALDILRFCNSLYTTKKPDRKLKTSRLVKGNTIFITLQ
ncbi:DUF6175 family protein [Tellurirhabdus rosea]|uniref:DUF6175 family protein n=1 Tax=Tellurirhabdus rosea TaxID=2674997 RepID=UPI002253D294|nr:DUF6175 family protein [Tellurirhabdus rosea]